MATKKMKPSKKAAVRTTRKGKRTAAGDDKADYLSPRAAEIFALLAFWTGVGMGRTFGEIPFEFSAEAQKAWLSHHVKSIRVAVDDKKVTTKLEIAKITGQFMGKWAARRALRRQELSPNLRNFTDLTQTVIVEHQDTSKAFNKARRYCAPGGGSGAYCAY